MPVLMQMLSIGGEGALVAKLWREHEGDGGKEAKGYLLYILVRYGFKIGQRKKQLWFDVLKDRRFRKLAATVAGLEQRITASEGQDQSPHLGGAELDTGDGGDDGYQREEDEVEDMLIPDIDEVDGEEVGNNQPLPDGERLGESVANSDPRRMLEEMRELHAGIVNQLDGFRVREQITAEELSALQDKQQKLEASQEKYAQQHHTLEHNFEENREMLAKNIEENQRTLEHIIEENHHRLEINIEANQQTCEQIIEENQHRLEKSVSGKVELFSSHLRDVQVGIQTVTEQLQITEHTIASNHHKLTTEVQNHQARVKEVTDDLTTITHNLQIGQQEQSDRLTTMSTITGDLQTRQNRLTGAIQSMKEDLRDLQANQDGSRAENKDGFSALTTLINTHIVQIPGPVIKDSNDSGNNWVFLRLRDCSVEAGDHVDGNPLYRRIFSAGEDNRSVSRAIVVSFSTPFLIALIGYSGGGKSHSAFGTDGILAAIIQRLPFVAIDVMQVMASRQALGSYTSDDLNIAEKITSSRESARTPANLQSSRTHLMVRFENAETGEYLGLLVDVAGPEESGNRAALDTTAMKTTSAQISNSNIQFRLLIQELVTAGKSNLIKYKHGSRLNSEVCEFLGRVKVTPTVRVLVCGDGTEVALVDKAVEMSPKL